MNKTGYERLPYRGESAQDRLAFEQYRADIQRGKSALQLKAIADQLTPDLRMWWSPQTFTGVRASAGDFDETVCTAAYHFHKHGQKYGTIRAYTEAARHYFRTAGQNAAPDPIDGLVHLPKGTFDRIGRIITFHD